MTYLQQRDTLGNQRKCKHISFKISRETKQLKKGRDGKNKEDP